MRFELKNGSIISLDDAKKKIAEYNVVIFDCFGTLIKFKKSPLFVQSLSNLLKISEINLNLKQILKICNFLETNVDIYKDKNWLNLFCKAGTIVNSNLKGSILCELYHKAFLSCCSPINDTIKLAEFAYTQNKETAIISNIMCKGYLVEDHLNKLGVLNYFKYRVWSTECLFWKPDISIFNYLIDKMNTSGDKICLLGDSIKNDIFPAQRLGFFSLRIIHD